MQDVHLVATQPTAAPPEGGLAPAAAPCQERHISAHCVAASAGAPMGCQHQIIT